MKNLLYILASLTVSVGSALASEMEGHSVHHSNHVGVFACGGTSNLDSGHNAFTFGADYERRLSDTIGVGILADFVFAHHRESIVAGTFVVHPAGAWKLMFAPGIVIVDGSSTKHFVARFGAG